ncbi:MAG: hypothetical protein QXT06_07800 [Candidatus Bathyarchaeia archaeon]|nr:hypothetical protein [Candidatus Bathyarchaeota archaeon]
MKDEDYPRNFYLSNDEESVPNIDLRDVLRKIKGELNMLCECLSKEKKIINEVCDSVEKILEKLKMSLNIPIKEAPLFDNAHRLILDDEGHLIVFHGNGKICSAPLRNYPPNVVASVLILAMPEFAKAISSYRMKIDSRISLFYCIRKGLRKILDNLNRGGANARRRGGI